MDRFDFMRSVLRGASVSAREQLKKLKFPRSIREALQAALHRQVRLTDKQLTAAVGCLSGISAVTIKASDGRLGVNAVLTDGGELIAGLIPAGLVCAPLGAKELAFRVEPASAAENTTLRELVGTIAGEIARAVWGPLLFQKSKNRHPAFVEREGDLLRVDLRTVSEVRAAMAQRATAMMIDALVVTRITAEDGALCLVLGLQGMP
ncbi:MAG: hypothetical protein JXA30_12015 [Deltaproteobacteria bacterium]|nr:hypothetical protein [Deltaproteobacteria bacterium]